jgi:HEAT repeat protein
LLWSQSNATRAAAIDVYGVFGTAKDLATVVGLAEHAPEVELDLRREEALRTTFAAILARDEAAFASLNQSMQGCGRDVLTALIFAVGDTRDERGLAFLTEVLGWRDDLANEVMSQVRVIGRSSLPIQSELADLVRRRLDSTSESSCRAAVLALGALEDVDSLPRLIELLDTDSIGLVHDAHWSLQRISGVSLPSDADAWWTWFDAESQWRGNELETLLADVESGDLDRCARALQAVSAHWLYRHEIADALLPQLESDDERVRRAVCVTLGDLRSPAAILALKVVLADEDDENATLAKLAERSLAQIQGQRAQNATHAR